MYKAPNQYVRVRAKAVKDPRQTDIFEFMANKPESEGIAGGRREGDCAAGSNGQACVNGSAQPQFHNMRDYQQEALEFIRRRGSSIIVMKTNSGKTEIEFALAADKLAQGKVIIVADTVLLSQQHYSSAISKFSGMLAPDEIALITGDNAERRKSPHGLYDRARLLIGTPESFVSDLSKGIFSMKDVSVAIFDEVQHMQNNDSYCAIATAALRAGVQRVGFSASPAGSVVKLRALFENMGTEHLFHVPDVVVERYVPTGKRVNIWVTLEPARRQITSRLQGVANETVYEILTRAQYYDMGKIVQVFGPLEKNFRMPYIREIKAAKDALLALKEESVRYSEVSNAVCASISSLAVLHHLMNMCTLVERVGCRELESYFERRILRGTSLAAETLRNDENIIWALKASRELKDHPKLDAVYEILNTEKGSALIFTETIHHAYYLSEEISHWGIPNAVLLGKGEMPAKKQLEIRRQFEEGKFRLLIATSVANEGVHMPNIMTLINYCVPYSVIDHKQRPGRVRDASGKSYTLVSMGTSEAHLLLAVKAREKSLENAFARML